jgi:transglutaminase-like putative cysteine protease
MRYRVRHRTEFHYGQPVSLGHNMAHLTPRDSAQQRLDAHTITVEPTAATEAWREDFFGNRTYYFAIEAPHRHLAVTAVSELTIDRTPEPEPASTHRPWDEVKQRIGHDSSTASVEARQYRFDSPRVAASSALQAYAAPSFPPGRSLAEAVAELTERIHEEFAFRPGSTRVTTPLAEVLERRQGVCQDFAHLAIGCLRSMGLPARYVSGYLETDPPPGRPRLTGADASHAWFAVFDPDVGWRDYDPTNNRIPGERHITTAWGRDYADVAPLRGILFGGGGGQSSAVAVDVERLSRPR